MHYVAKNDSEQKWERDAGKDSWVYFLVGWNSIGVCKLLEGPQEFICPE